MARHLKRGPPEAGAVSAREAEEAGRPMRDVTLAALRRVYDVFAIYESVQVTDGDIILPLFAKPLAGLTSAELDYYASHAMTTVGGEEEFKYLLPRLLE